VPTKLLKFLGARTSNMAFMYDFEGSIRYLLAVRYGDMHCSNVDQLFARTYERPPGRSSVGRPSRQGIATALPSPAKVVA